MASGISMTSFESVAALIGHMAQQERAESSKSKGLEVKEAYDQKKDAKEAIKEMKADIEALHQKELSTENPFWSCWGLFGDGGRSDMREEQLKTGIQVEKTQQDVVASQAEIESIQRDIKDVHEDFESSKSLVEDVRKEIEAVGQAVTTF